jgi:hypothetical protein
MVVQVIYSVWCFAVADGLPGSARKCAGHSYTGRCSVGEGRIDGLLSFCVSLGLLFFLSFRRFDRSRSPSLVPPWLIGVGGLARHPCLNFIAASTDLTSRQDSSPFLRNQLHITSSSRLMVSSRVRFSSC